MIPSLGSINLLEWLIELKETLNLYSFIYYNRNTKDIMKSQMEKMYRAKTWVWVLEIYAFRYTLSCLEDLQNFVLEDF